MTSAVRRIDRRKGQRGTEKQGQRPRETYTVHAEKDEWQKQTERVTDRTGC